MTGHRQPGPAGGSVGRPFRCYGWVASIDSAIWRKTQPSLRVRASLHRAPALPARIGVLALPGLPPLAGKPLAGHARRQGAVQPARTRGSLASAAWSADRRQSPAVIAAAARAAGRAGRRTASGGHGGCHLPDGDRLWIVARRDAPDHHVTADGPLDLTIVPADLKRTDPELAHQVPRLAQGLPGVDVSRIRFRGLARAGHRDPQMPLPGPHARLASPRPPVAARDLAGRP